MLSKIKKIFLQHLIDYVKASRETYRDLRDGMSDENRYEYYCGKIEAYSDIIDFIYQEIGG